MLVLPWFNQLEPLEHPFHGLGLHLCNLDVKILKQDSGAWVTSRGHPWEHCVLPWPFAIHTMQVWCISWYRWPWQDVGMNQRKGRVMMQWHNWANAITDGVVQCSVNITTNYPWPWVLLWAVGLLGRPFNFLILLLTLSSRVVDGHSWGRILRSWCSPDVKDDMRVKIFLRNFNSFQYISVGMRKLSWVRKELLKELRREWSDKTECIKD